MKEAEEFAQSMQGVAALGKEARVEIAVTDEPCELQFCDKRALF